MSIVQTVTPYWYVYYDTPYGYAKSTYTNDKDVVFKLAKESRVKPNPLTFTSRSGAYKYHEQRGIYGYIYYGYTYRYDYSVYAPPPNFTKVWSNELLSQINSEFINLSMYMAELRSTITLAADVGKALVNIFTSVTNPVKFAKSISNAWLSYTYGLAPTVDDLNKAALGMHDLMNGYPIKFKGKFSETVNQNYNNSSYEISRSDTKITKYAVRCMLSQPSMFYYGGPVSTLWEMIPYSFVFDWFIPVSDYLAACDTHRLVESAYGWVSNRTKFELVGSHKRYSSGSYNYFNDRNYKYQYETFDRSVVISIPTPSLPRYSPHLGTQRLLNSAALLTQLLK